jgi:hypothetical protein
MIFDNHSFFTNLTQRSAAQRHHFRGEEVGPRQQRQMSSNENRPRRRAFALRRGRQAAMGAIGPRKKVADDARRGYA